MAIVDDYSIMEKVKAARGFINGVRSLSAEQAAELELEAFMSIFHPKVYADRTRMQGLREGVRQTREQRTNSRRRP